MSVTIVESLTAIPEVVSLPCALQLRQTLSATKNREVHIEYSLVAGNNIFFDEPDGARQSVTRFITVGVVPTAFSHTVRIRASSGGGPMDGVFRLHQTINSEEGVVHDSVTIFVVTS
jgi:hypothetical protein